MKSRLGETLVRLIVVTSVSALVVPDDLGCHDPSRIIQDNGGYYFYGTSNDLTGWYTTDDGNSWNPTPPVFPNGIPEEVHAACPQNDGHSVWAPDMIWNPNTNLFYMYYAVASWNDETRSVIGLVTSPTLDLTTANWKDEGVVIAKTPEDATFNAIDPGPFFDANGDMWLSLGSGYVSTRNTAINVIALDKNTGLRSDSETHVVQACSCEASYVQPSNGFYYLFWNTGGCCYGASSTYTIHVSRSSSVTGPYTEDRIFDQSNSTVHGPGHIGILSDGGVDYFSYHYYPNTGGSVLGFDVLTWGADGWPTK